MSEEQPKQPEVEQSATPTPTRPPAPSQSSSTVQQVTQTLKQSWEQVKPVLKTQGAKALRTTIRGLETAAEKLEEPSESSTTSASPQSTSARSTSGTTTPPLNPNELLEKVRPAIANLQTWSNTAIEKAQPQLEKIKPQLAKLQPYLEKLKAWWAVTLPKIRTRLPESANEKLSDQALTNIAIAGVALVFFWTTSAIIPDKPHTPQVARVPISQRVPPADLTAPPELSAPAAETPVTTTPAIAPVEPEIAEPEITEPEVAAIPSELTEPAEPEAIAQLPPPAPILTPEQQLLLSIQEQVAEAAKPYAKNVVQTIEANFQTSRLGVNVSDAWYSLPSARQDKLANALRDRAQDLDFNTLQIKDSSGSVVARSPIVGSEMVILKRQSAGVA